MEWFKSEQLGPTRSLTPEGFLLCEHVPIARTGPMLYMAGEVPITPSSDGVIRILRQPEDVFAPETIASYHGKPVVLDHPAEPVTAASWKKYAVGTMFNIQRGTGLQDDYLFADLLITDEEAISDMEGVNPDVSCGYDAEYEELAPGRGRQFNIIGNHLAILLDKRGRCGPTCSIGDSEMAVSVVDRVRAAFRTNDQKAFDAAMGDLMGGAPMGSPPQQDPNAPPTGASMGNPHRIIVNVHGGAASGGDAPGAPAAPATPSASPAPPPAVAPSPNGAGSMDQRMAALEAAIMKLTQIVQAAVDGDEDTEEAPGAPGGAPNPEAGNEGGGPPEDDTNDKKTYGGDMDNGDVEDGADNTGKKAMMPNMKLPAKTPNINQASNQGKTEGMMGDTHGSGGSTMDSAALVQQYQDVVSRAEILFPGLKPKATFDAKAKATTTMDCICDLQRRALVGANGVERTKKLIAPLLGERDVSKLTNDMLSTIFMGASELVRLNTNSGMLRSKVVGGDGGSKGVPTIAEINKKNEEFWKNRGAA